MKTSPLSTAKPGAAALGALLLLLLPAGQAWAGNFDVFGFGTRSLSMGGAMTAAADDYTAVYYNPAALTLRKKVHLGVELYTSLPNLEITPLRPPNEGFEPEPVNPHSGMSLGVLFPFGGELDNRFAVGLGVHVPFGGLLSAEFLDPQVPQWHLYNSLPRKLHAVGAISYQPLSWLHIGLGAQVLADVDGGATIALDLPNESLPRRDVGVEIVTTASLTAGLLLTPPFLEGLRVGANWREALALDIALPISFDLGETLDFVVAVAGTALYVPETYSFGLAYDLRPALGAPLNVALDLSWARWSQAPSPELDVIIDVSGDAVEDLGFEDGLDFATGAVPPAGFEDTLTWRLGLEFFATEAFAVRAGYGRRGAALGPQGSFTNYVDAPAHIIGAGTAVTVKDPLEIDENPVTFEVGAHVALLDEVSVKKSNPEDPVGDYTSGGQVLMLSVSARHDF